MSALRRTGGAMLNTTEGTFTHLLHEALAIALDEELRSAVIREAGWDEARGVPLDAATSPLQWLDAHLFPKLADHVGAKVADDLRRQARALFLNAANSMPAPPIARPSGGARRSSISGVRRSDGNARSSGTRPTQIPRVGATSVLVLSSERELAITLDEALGGRASVCVVETIDELEDELRIFASNASMVVLDLRNRDARMLRALAGDTLSEQQVLVWGVRTLDTPELQRVLLEAERSIGCTDEADVRDVAGLCAALLGLN